MNAFPDNLKEIDKSGRILLRVNNDLTVLIQSALCPDWSFLIKEDQYLLINPMIKQFDYPQFKEGQKFWFRLFGNPTKKIEGKRVGMYKEEKQYIWLNRKSDMCGFNLIHVNITKKEEITARAGRNSKVMTFYGVQFEGMLQVVDSNKFKVTMENGIGSGKSFGFGFLTISKF